MAGRARILIVDDEPLNVDLLEQELELLGYATVAAADGRRALERLAGEPIDLVLLDIMMPGLDGYETCRRLKADPSTAAIPVVFLTARTQKAEVEQAKTLGAVTCLIKPFDPMTLAGELRAALGW